MYKKVHTNFIHSSQTLETSQMLIKRKTNKLVYSYHGILHSRKEQIVGLKNDINKSQILCWNERNHTQEGTYMRFKNSQNLLVMTEINSGYLLGRG